MLLSIGLLAFIPSILILQALCQNSVQTFNWKFASTIGSQALPICQAIPIDVFPTPYNSTAGGFSGIPPYYMTAFPENGQPITSALRNDTGMLAWTPTHPVGTRIIIQLTDSTGSTGGGGGEVFHVADNSNGGNTDCAAPPLTTNFFLSSNITQHGQTILQTCQPWRLNINGGEHPCTLVLGTANSPVMTNITIIVGEDAVVYINRADPDTTLFAGVVNRSGRWATGTQFVQTGGSVDVTCVSGRTIVTTQARLDIPDLRAFKNRRRLLIIACITAGLISLMLIVGGLGISSNTRQRRLNKARFSQLGGGRPSLSSPSIPLNRLASKRGD